MQFRSMILFMHLYFLMCVWWNIIKHSTSIQPGCKNHKYIYKNRAVLCTKPSHRGRIWTIQQLKVCKTSTFAHFNPVLSGGILRHTLSLQGHLLVCPTLCGCTELLWTGGASWSAHSSSVGIRIPPGSQNQQLHKPHGPALWLKEWK